MKLSCHVGPPEVATPLSLDVLNCQSYLEGLLKHRLLGLTPSGLSNLRMCYLFLDAAAAMSLGIRCSEPLLEWSTAQWEEVL